MYTTVLRRNVLIRDIVHLSLTPVKVIAILVRKDETVNGQTRTCNY